ncbi:MAG: hypothetical protein GY720_00420 [bacterium]|nr:hypothetical protein [bacterium]
MSRLSDLSNGQSGGLLSAGKRRGLAATSSSRGVFSILAIDHLAALSATLQPDNPDSVRPRKLAAVKVNLVEWLASRASGILIDPIVGLEPVAEAAVRPDSCGLMIGLEDGDYASLTEAPKLFAGWDVLRAKNSRADAIKCSFLYDPYVDSPPAHEFVAALVDDCNEHDLPLFVEPLSPHPLPGDRRTVVVDAAERIGALGVDVLKLEFPVDAAETDEGLWRAACEELTAVSPRPWTLLSGGTDFDTFVRQLTVACQSGASGYVAGRSIWGDLVSGGFDDGLKARGEAERRLGLLSDISEAYARSWISWFESSGESTSTPPESRIH